MKLNTENPTQGVLDAAKAVDELAWGMDDPLDVPRDATIELNAGALLDLRWAINYRDMREESERGKFPGPDVAEHPEDYDGPCYCQECLANAR